MSITQMLTKCLKLHECYYCTSNCITESITTYKSEHIKTPPIYYYTFIIPNFYGNIHQGGKYFEKKRINNVYTSVLRNGTRKSNLTGDRVAKWI